MGVSAVLVAALHQPCEALQRDASDEQTQSAPAGLRMAEAGSVNLPAARASGLSGKPIPLTLGLKSSAGGVRFIKISDFPDELQLSRGFRLRGSWITAVNDLDELELITPPGLAKTIKLNVLYFRNNQTPAVAQRVLLIDLEPGEPVISPAPRQEARAEPQQETRAEPTPAAAQPPIVLLRPPAPSSTMSAEQEAESLERGAVLMRNGDIAAARLLYEDLALGGSAKGARALAETYDPVYLKGVFIAGLQPNPEKAKIWYARAAELGDIVSITRLSALDRR